MGTLKPFAATETVFLPLWRIGDALATLPPAMMHGGGVGVWAELEVAVAEVDEPWATPHCMRKFLSPASTPDDDDDDELAAAALEGRELADGGTGTGTG